MSRDVIDTQALVKLLNDQLERHDRLIVVTARYSNELF